MPQSVVSRLRPLFNQVSCKSHGDGFHGEMKRLGSGYVMKEMLPMSVLKKNCHGDNDEHKVMNSVNIKQLNWLNWFSIHTLSLHIVK